MRRRRRDEIGDEATLLCLEGRDGVVSSDHGSGHLERVGAPVEHVGNRDREIADQCGMGHVPEIADPYDRAGLVDEQILPAHVVVDDLCPQVVDHRANPRVESLDYLRGDFAHCPAQVRETGAKARGAPDVPLDLVAGGRMEEAPQCPPQPGDRLAPFEESPVIQLLPFRVTAPEEREQPHEGFAPVRSCRRPPRRPIERGDDLAHRQSRVDTRNVAKGGGLHLYNVESISGVIELEEEAGAVAKGDSEVEVTLAVEGEQLSGEPESCLQHR